MRDAFGKNHRNFTPAGKFKPSLGNEAIDFNFPCSQTCTQSIREHVILLKLSDHLRKFLQTKDILLNITKNPCPLPMQLENIFKSFRICHHGLLLKNGPHGAYFWFAPIWHWIFTKISNSGYMLEKQLLLEWFLWLEKPNSVMNATSESKVLRKYTSKKLEI